MLNPGGSALLQWEYEVEGSAEQSIVVPAANLGGTRYNLEIQLIPGGASGAIGTHINGDTTDANYTNQFVSADAAAITSGRQANPNLVL
jgi:hypothetical protein